MGDRTTVHILIGGDLPADQVEAFLKLMDEARFEEPVTREDLQKGEVLERYAYDVNYASLEVEQQIRTLGLPYVKEWEPGGDYGSGIEIFDGTTTLEFDAVRSGTTVTATTLASWVESGNLTVEVQQFLQQISFVPPPLRII